MSCDMRARTGRACRLAAKNQEDDATMTMDDHMQHMKLANDLFATGDASHVAVRSGSWSDAAGGASGLPRWAVPSG